MNDRAKQVIRGVRKNNGGAAPAASPSGSQNSAANNWGLTERQMQIARNVALQNPAAGNRLDTWIKGAYMDADKLLSTPGATGTELDRAARALTSMQRRTNILGSINDLLGDQGPDPAGEYLGQARTNYARLLDDLNAQRKALTERQALAGRPLFQPKTQETPLASPLEGLRTAGRAADSSRVIGTETPMSREKSILSPRCLGILESGNSCEKRNSIFGRKNFIISFPQKSASDFLSESLKFSYLFLSNKKISSVTRNALLSRFLIFDKSESSSIVVVTAS